MTAPSYSKIRDGDVRLTADADIAFKTGVECLVNGFSNRDMDAFVFGYVNKRATWVMSEAVDAYFAWKREQS